MNDGVRSMFSLERVCGVLGGERMSCIQGGWVVYMYSMLSTQNGNYITLPYYEHTNGNLCQLPEDQWSVSCVNNVFPLSIHSLLFIVWNITCMLSCRMPFKCLSVVLSSACLSHTLTKPLPPPLTLLCCSVHVPIQKYNRWEYWDSVV